MQRIPNEWHKLNYLDPETVLLGLREVQYSGVLEALPYKTQALRTRDLRHFQEGRQAALFCYGMSYRIGKKVLFSMVEEQDYDFVAFYQDDDMQRFAPVQLKELVPPETVPNGRLPQLQEEIDKLKKYTDSDNLVVAMHINRNTIVNPASLRPPLVNLGALWLFGATDSQQQTWMLMGNLLKPDSVVFHFEYPTTSLRPDEIAPLGATNGDLDGNSANRRAFWVAMANELFFWGRENNSMAMNATGFTVNA